MMNLPAECEEMNLNNKRKYETLDELSDNEQENRFNQPEKIESTCSWNSVYEIKRTHTDDEGNNSNNSVLMSTNVESTKLCDKPLVINSQYENRGSFRNMSTKNGLDGNDMSVLTLVNESISQPLHVGDVKEVNDVIMTCSDASRASVEVKTEEEVVATPDIMSFLTEKTETIESNNAQDSGKSNSLSTVNIDIEKSSNESNTCSNNKAGFEEKEQDEHNPKLHQDTLKMKLTKAVAAKSCKCGCLEELGINTIKIIFDRFNNIKCLNKQNVYLSDCVRHSGVKRSCVQDSTDKALKHVNYVVKTNDREFNLCRQAFYIVHGIKEKRMKTILSKHENYELPKKTRSTPSIAVSVERKKIVHGHIGSFPTLSSRFSKAKNSLKTFLTPGLNINIMYTLYLEWVKKHKDVQPVTSHCYNNIFDECHVGFSPPMNNTCKICNKIDSEVYREKDYITEQRHLEHLAEVDYVQKLLVSYKDDTDPTVAAICINLQPALPTPKLSTRLHYYKKKLWVYNFAVHDLKSGRAVAYLWNESIAKRGAAELSSCLLQYINTYVDHNVKTLVIFSNNSKTYHKHIDIVLTWLQKIHEGRFHYVKHIFMMPGHSTLPCDRDYGNIERKIRPVEVCSQESYAKLIQNCRNPRKYEIYHMSRSRFFNISLLQTMVDKKQLHATGFKDAKVLMFAHSYKQGFGIKATYQQNDYFYIQLQRNMSSMYDPITFNLSRINIPLKYPGPLRISSEKICDLKELLMHVQSHQKQFLSSLISEQESMINTIYIQDDYASDDDFIDY